MSYEDPHWPRASVWLASESADPELVVVGVPNSKASITPSRADLTPGALREHLSRFSTFDGTRMIDLGSVAVSDLGNWAVSEMDVRQMQTEVEKHAKRLKTAPLTVFFGGDNAITAPLVKGVASDLSRVGLITFDAHHDVRVTSNGANSGSPMRELVEAGLPGRNIAQIGISAFGNSRVYRSFATDAGITVATVADVADEGIGAIVGRALDDLGSRCKSIYVDVDLDVLDVVVAPGCPGARPGGLTIRELADGVFQAARHDLVRWIDLVEVDAAADRGGLTLDSMAFVFLSCVAGLAIRGQTTSS